MFGSFPPSLWLVCATRVYSGLGADIVMESLHSLTGGLANKRRKLVRTPVNNR